MFRVILNYARTGFSPSHIHSRVYPCTTVFVDESFGALSLLPCESVFAWALAPTSQVGVETLLEVQCALIRPCASAPAVGLFLVSAWEFMGKVHLTRRFRTPQSHHSYQVPIHLCAFVPKRRFCCDVTLGHPFDNLSMCRSHLCVDQEPRQEEWQLRNLSEAPSVHADASELRPS